MSWGLIARSAIAIGGSLIAGNQSSNAAKDAANVSAGASDRASQVVDEAQRRLEARMQPYIATGRAADANINAFLGLPAPAAATATTQASAPGAQMSEAELRQRFPTEAADWDRMERAGSSRTNGHHQLYGNFTGYIFRLHGVDSLLAPPPAPPQTANQAAPQAQAMQTAMAAYEQSPWAKFAADGAETARQNAEEAYMSSAGARRSIVSGRTARGLQELAQEAEDQRFRTGFTEGYFPAISGVSQRGYNAAVGVGDSSLSTAAQIGAAGQRAADARAEGMRDAADIRANSVNAALYYGGQAYDAWANRNQKPPAQSGPVNLTKPRNTVSAAQKYSGG